MQRIYADTSVFGGYYDDEFSEHTIPFFEKLAANEFVLLYSSVTEDELGNAPENVKELVKSIKKLKSLYKRKKITYAHMRQIGTTMQQRSRYHSHPTKDIKEASKVWKRFNRSFKK